MTLSDHKRLLLFFYLLAVLVVQACGVNSAATPALTQPTVPQPLATETEVPAVQPGIEVTAPGQPDLSQMDVEEWASTSPDGKWIAVGLIALPKPNADRVQAYIRLTIFSADREIHWKIIDQWQEIGLGFPTPAALKWSRDGKYFYFTHRVVPDGCNVFTYLTDLQRVDLSDGSVSDLLPESITAVALAPDDSQVAFSYFSRPSEISLMVKNLITGEERETKINPGKEFNAGNILWSPDGRSIALTLAIQPCAGDHHTSMTVWAESTSILLIQSATLEQKILVNEDPRLFITVEWNEPDKIVVTDGEENSLWQLDMNTGEITRP